MQPDTAEMVGVHADTKSLIYQRRFLFHTQSLIFYIGKCCGSHTSRESRLSWLAWLMSMVLERSSERSTLESGSLFHALVCTEASSGKRSSASASSGAPKRTTFRSGTFSVECMLEVEGALSSLCQHQLNISKVPVEQKAVLTKVQARDLRKGWKSGILSSPRQFPRSVLACTQWPFACTQWAAA